MRMISFSILMTVFFLFSMSVYAQAYYEIDGSPYGTSDALVPSHIKAPGEKIILIDPKENAWGAYSANGKLIRWGIATTGSEWCSDIKRACHTKTGSYRIYSLGDGGCVSSKFPVAEGGAPMPYCMYFNGGQAIHGADEVAFGNQSHGCVRVHVSDAKWLRYHFVEGPIASNQYRGTKVVIKRY